MCHDWTPAEFLIGVLSRSRIEGETSDRRAESLSPVRATLSDWSPDCMKRVCRVPVPNFSPFSLSALSTGINAVQFHSLNSAFPGQSQAFTEFSPYTPNSGERKKKKHTPKPPHLSNHPFILYLCSCNLNWAFFKCSFNSVLLQEAEQGGDTVWAKGNTGNQLVFILFPLSR